MGLVELVLPTGVTRTCGTRFTFPESFPNRGIELLL
jgi:hypothetical protein